MSMTTFQPGTELRTKRKGNVLQIREHLGTGGQGEVYRVDVDDGRKMALKWYLPSVADRQQFRRLQKLVERGAPSPDFLWPEEMVTTDSGTGFGYLMALRPRGFCSIVALMKDRVNPSFRVLANTAMNLADAFLDLHSRGLCYGDISFGNVFFHPDTGEVRVCDNDNVVTDGSDKITVMGTPRFMAPEIVRREGLPNSDTDRYSLAVLLFYLFMVGHPLEGKREEEIRCLDLPAMERLYGEDPLFIFDPDSDENGPVEGRHNLVMTYWKLYPHFLRRLFTRSFTSGLWSPRDGRVRESEWRGAMGRLIDSITYCDCGAEIFYDAHHLRHCGGKMPPCWSCGQLPELPPRIRIGDRIVVMTEDTRLGPRHLSRFPSEDGRNLNAVCKVDGSGRLTLVNRTADPWSATASDHSTRSVKPGRSVKLEDGLEIHFGQVRGKVRV